MTDKLLESKVEQLKQTIHSWAVSHHLWTDTWFSTWREYMDDEPEETPVVLILITEGPLYGILNGYNDEMGLLDEFDELINQTEFYYEMHDNVTMCFYPSDESLIDMYKDYYEWIWVCELITPDYSDIYEEIFQRFSRKPEDLYRLHPRKFEILLDAIFRNNGFKTELGPGQGDGGVDIRLYSNSVIGEAVTLVQAKRYSLSNPIELQAVQALSAAVEDERANSGLFVTTSRYLPGVKKFAERNKNRIKLATSSDVMAWSKEASTRIIRDKSTLISTDSIKPILEWVRNNGIKGKVFHTKIGYNMTNNIFILLLKETKGAALAVKLPNAIVKDYGLGLSGTHTPVINSSIIDHLNKSNIIRVKKISDNNGTMWLKGNGHHFHQWDGLPKNFDLCD